MSMLSSCNLLCRAPPLSKCSSAPMQTMRSGKQASTAVALPVPDRVVVLRKQQSRRARLFVCHAESNNNKKLTYFKIQPFALVHPKFPPTSTGYWKVTEEANQISLGVFVGADTTKDKLEVATENDVLLIRYTGDSMDDTPASLLDVRLLVPDGFDKSKVKAEFTSDDGWLQVTVPKRLIDDDRRKKLITIDERKLSTSTPSPSRSPQQK